MKTKIRKIALAIFASFLIASTAFATDPPVKKSKSGICHPKGGQYYSRTKYYTPYQSMEACIKSGGRRAKR